MKTVSQPINSIFVPLICVFRCSTIHVFNSHKISDKRDLKMAEGIRGFNQSRLPLGCGSIDSCNNFCPFQVRRQLAEWRFLKHSAIHRRQPLLQLPEFLPEDHPLSDTDCVQADGSTLCVRSQYRQLGDIQGVSVYKFEISQRKK